jgi:hypothetical protein
MGKILGKPIREEKIVFTKNNSVLGGIDALFLSTERIKYG